MKLMSEDGPIPTYRHREFYIPDHMMQGLRDYIVHGAEPGHFLEAIICNDLLDACARADEENARNLPAFAAYIYNEAPSGCWGSRVRMHAWMAERRTWMAQRKAAAANERRE